MGYCCETFGTHCGVFAVDCCRVVENNISRFYGSECYVSESLPAGDMYLTGFIGLLMITIIIYCIVGLIRSWREAAKHGRKRNKR